MKCRVQISFLLSLAILFAVWENIVNAAGFSWNNCNEGDPTTITYINIQPDPIVLPGIINLDLQAVATQELEAPGKLVVLVQKRVHKVWKDIGCIRHFGSCTYDDFCSFLEVLYPPDQPCPESMVLHGIPCHCPIPAGSYSIKDLSIPLQFQLPAVLANGDYHIRMTFYSNATTEITCFDVYATIKVAH